MRFASAPTSSLHRLLTPLRSYTLPNSFDYKCVHHPTISIAIASTMSTDTTRAEGVEGGGGAAAAAAEVREEVESDSVAKRRGRPPLSYTDDFHTPSSITLQSIGVVRSVYKERFGTPRQPNVTENTLGNQAQPARIELYKHTRHELSLRGLSEFEYVWVITYFHLNQGFSPLVTPPRGPRRKQGVLATRSPHRMNSIGLSCIKLTSVDEKAGVIHLLGVDLLDGTPVMDIKPYVPYCDAYPNAKAGWLDKLNEDMKAPDKLSYDPPPAHITRPVQLPPQLRNGNDTDIDRNGEVDKSSSETEQKKP